MSSESQTLSTAKSDAPAYKVIAEQIAALMLAGEQSGMDQSTIQAAIHAFVSITHQPADYRQGNPVGSNRAQCAEIGRG